MELSQAIPWLIAAGSLAYNMLRDSGSYRKALEDRVRTLEQDRIKDKLVHTHQLELMQTQVVNAQATVQDTRNMITRALNHAN